VDIALRDARTMTRAKAPFETYRDAREFRRVPASAGKTAWQKDNPVFVIHQHGARQLHYDFRLQVEGVLKSWAVPKGPSTDPRDKRLAVQVEDHALEYADFEGVIAAGEYGAGPVIVWDAGPYRNIKRDRRGREVPMTKALELGTVEIWLEGRKIRGGYALIRTRFGGKRQSWLLIKMKDEAADARRIPTESEPWSVLSGRTLAEVAEEKA
jgi:DNA ligase D-like protein (predicted 3'-phosphoesterase)